MELTCEGVTRLPRFGARCAETYDKSSSDTSKDGSDYEKEERTPDAETRFFLFLNVLRVMAAVFITCHIGSFRIRLRRICSPIEYSRQMEDPLSTGRHNTLVLSGLLF